MQLGRFGFARSVSLFAIFPLVICALESSSLAQNPSQNSDSETGTLPAAQPLSVIAHPASRASGENARTAQGDSKESAWSSGVDSSRVKLGAGDLIEISVYNVPELSTKARVGNSGDVYLPLIDYVHVGGLTVDEAQVVIQKRLEDGGFVRNAHVTIFVDETSQTVTILGEVARPGMYPALGERRLYDFISAAGGFTAAAGRKVSIIRQHGDAPITLGLPRNLGDDVKDNIEIFPGDTISVPKAPIIYVVGDVGRPTGLLVDNGTLTVLQAIALAGGTNHTAKMGGVRIIRKAPEGMTETKVPLKKMLEAKVPDITLQADDILFVPLSGARVAASQGIQAVVTATTGLAIIAAHP
jgi:polysaccharide biosynthesis/export protein